MASVITASNYYTLKQRTMDRQLTEPVGTVFFSSADNSLPESFVSRRRSRPTAKRLNHCCYGSPGSGAVSADAAGKKEESPLSRIQLGKAKFPRKIIIFRGKRHYYPQLPGFCINATFSPCEKVFFDPREPPPPSGGTHIKMKIYKIFMEFSIFMQG